MGRDPIKFILGLGFTSVLALMAMISALSLTQLNTVTDQLTELHRETSAKVSAAHTMRDSIRLRGDTLNKMYVTDDFIERDELRIDMGVHALDYKNARDQLYSYAMTAREARLLDELMTRTRAAKALNDTASSDLLSDKGDEEVRQSMLAANNARQDMLGGLSALVNLQEKIASDRLQDARAYQENLSYLIVCLCLIAILIAVYIALKVIRETSRKSSEIHFHATHDNLTELPNRLEFNNRLRAACQSARESKQQHVLCYLDLDRFKAVNDNCGHKAGDKLLVELTRLIRNHIRSHDILARLGGDEFALILEDCSLEKAVEITEGIVNIVRNYEFKWQQHAYFVGVSIGLVTINNSRCNPEAILHDADTACYAAKDLGRNQVHVHGQNLQRGSKIQNELNWLSQIDKDEQNRFSLYMQQIKQLSADDHSEMFEVLLRLNDDEGRLVPPSSYLPAAERFSLMKNVDFWVISHSLEILDGFNRMPEKRDIKLFINISINTVLDPDFIDYVVQRCLHFNIHAGSICFEIEEEKAAKNVNKLGEIIDKLRPHGIRFALDDFGAGVPSIAYLKNLHVDYIKINGNVVKNITQSITDRAMLAAVAEVGRVMNIQTIAKHVENAFVLNQLQEMNIDYVQGFHVQRPCALLHCFDNNEASNQNASKA